MVRRFAVQCALPSRPSDTLGSLLHLAPDPAGNQIVQVSSNRVLSVFYADESSLARLEKVASPRSNLNNTAEPRREQLVLIVGIV